MANRNSIWVDGPRPSDGTTLDIVNAMPVTHLASHPHVGTEEIIGATNGRLSAVGYDMEGLLVRYGETEVSDEVMSWLDNEQSAYNIGRFVLTSCRDYEKVQAWSQQMSKLGMRVYHPHVRKLNTVSALVEHKVDKSLRKPSPKLFLRAALELNFIETDAAFVGDKLSDAEGAIAASYAAAILTPRFGQSDHFLDPWTRHKQIVFMRENGLEFPEYTLAA